MDLHRDVARAGSFGSVAEQYDRYRLSYPAALIDDLVALRPARVLDVGCGTGKVAVALAERGLSVLGVEVDERMAGVARGHGIEVEAGGFETWDPAGRTFDLITSGDAWHWIDPAAGVAQAARAGGTVARFWTAVSGPDFDPVYRVHAPELVQDWVPRFHATLPDLFAQSGVFTPAELRAYPWEHTFTTDEWLGLAATISNHQRLGPARLTALLDALRTVIDDDLGGAVTTGNETYLLLSRRI